MREHCKWIHIRMVSSDLRQNIRSHDDIRYAVINKSAASLRVDSVVSIEANVIFDNFRLYNLGSSHSCWSI